LQGCRSSGETDDNNSQAYHLKFEEQYELQLKGIETAIIGVRSRERELVDSEVDRALEALIDHYVAQLRKRPPRDFRLGARDQMVFADVQTAANGLLHPTPEPATGESSQVKPLTLNELLDCLKRIRKSVAFWTEREGRRGYLNFVAMHVPSGDEKENR
jgi:hypothetical protein